MGRSSSAGDRHEGTGLEFWADLGLGSEFTVALLKRDCILGAHLLWLGAKRDGEFQNWCQREMNCIAQEYDITSYMC